MAYQDALLDQLDPTRKQMTAPGYQPGGTAVDVPANGNTGANGGNTDVPVGGMKDYRQIFTDTMQPFGYGHDALAKGKDALAAQGIKSYVDSSGMSRGRVELPGGDRFDVFDPVEGRTESNNWQTNPQGSNWNWQAMGRDAGNSAKFAENAPQMDVASMLQGPSPFTTQPQTGQDAITAGVEQYSQPSKYLEALLAQLGGQAQ